MFRELDLEVSIGPPVLLRFSEPLSILSLVVADPSEDMVWTLRPAGMESVEDGAVTEEFLAEEAPAEIQMLWLQARADHGKRLAESGPAFPLVREVVYGVVPDGYEQEEPAVPLQEGVHTVVVIAEQGSGSVSFRIDAFAPPDVLGAVAGPS